MKHIIFIFVFLGLFLNVFFFFSNIKTFAQNKEKITFEKSYKKSKGKKFSKTIIKDSTRNEYGAEGSRIDKNFRIYFDKKENSVGNIPFYSFGFGYYPITIEGKCYYYSRKYKRFHKRLYKKTKREMEMLCKNDDKIFFEGDTIFCYPKLEYGFERKNPIFILSENFVDTLLVKQFPYLHNKLVKLDSKIYYPKIKNDVYVFKIWRDDEYYYRKYPETRDWVIPFDFFLKEKIPLRRNFNLYEIAISKLHGIVWVKFTEDYYEKNTYIDKTIWYY